VDYYTQQLDRLKKTLAASDRYSCAAQFAQQALLKEVCLSPKPGLVDSINSGAHHDMNFDTFIRSIDAITPYLEQFYCHGQSASNVAEHALLSGLRQIGLACERAMFSATGQVNTHKGGIFAFGLLLGAIGQLEAQQRTVNYQTICQKVAGICRGIVNQELIQKQTVSTVGENLFKQYQLTGARGEAESGYMTVRNIALPAYLDMRQQGYDEETSLLQSLLYLLAYNNDTNLVSRGGMDGLQFVQQAAKALIDKGGMCHHASRANLADLDQQLIARHLSPGGSADLVAITWFLAQYI
jgi:triphosphoribosyl-dephospho-CoA synthase